jgi:septum site-determining protein MinC
VKLRGTSGGLNLLIEPGDTPDGLSEALESRSQLLTERVEVEISGPVLPEVLVRVLEAVTAAGGAVNAVRPSRDAVGPAPAPSPVVVNQPVVQMPAPRTEIILKTLRSGTRKEVQGSVIVVGDVNSGVELIAGGDIVVLGTLRGLAHAGAFGGEEAIIWAQRIAAPQVRIAGAVARAPEDQGLEGMRVHDQAGAEVARLANGQIIIEPYGG